MTIKNKMKIAGLIGLLSVLPAKEKISTISQAREILNTEDITNLPNGYKTSEGIKMTMRELAGIYNGGIELYKEEGKNFTSYISFGVYSQAKDPGSYEKVIENADVNKDKIITREEIRDLQKKVYKKYAIEKK